MKRFMALAAAVVVVGLVGGVSAEEKADPTGTWKWTTTFNNQTREQTLKLKLEGDKLSGALVGRNDRETPIEDATYKDGTVSFKVTRTRNDQSFVTKYTGTVSGDSIKGKTESERGGQTRTQDWEAKKAN